MRALVLWIAAALLSSSVMARADEVQSGPVWVGARSTFFRPSDSDHGAWGPGAQVRAGLDEGWALEASADFVRHYAGGTSFQVIPVQVTALGYLYPNAGLSPYLLAGGGWYVGERPFGPHVGAGLEAQLGGGWSLGFDWRLLWTAAWRLTDSIGHPYGNRYRARGSMLVGSLNRRF